jgi:signal transduction histidine kinase/HD-GYP domain-containing protein (c-di-GMP phosphodiesterase class II)
MLGIRSHVSIVQSGREAASELYLRIVELLAFFIIVFGAKEIANFDYESNIFLFWFLLAAAGHYYGEVFWAYWGRKREWNRERTEATVLWYSSLLDFLVVLGIIYMTGTVESPFLFLLVVPLIFVSHIFPWKITFGGFLSFAIGAVALLGYLELRHIIPHFNCYTFKNEMYLNPHYYVGSLLVLGAFSSLVLFLSDVFQDRFQVSLEKLRARGLESESKLTELTRLYDISIGVNSVMSLDVLLKMVAKEATLLLSQPWASILLFNSKNEITDAVFVGIRDNHERRLNNKIRKGGITEWIAKNNQALVIEDILADKRASTGEFLLSTKIRSLIGYPLTVGHHVVGVIYVGDFVKKRFANADVRLMAILSDQLSITIQKSKLYRSLQRKINKFQRKIAGLEKVNSLKSEFVSHVSHELKTPLTSIKAYIEAIQSHIDDPKFSRKEEFLSIVANETERLIRIVDDVLDISNIEFGQRPLERKVLALKDVVDEVLSTMQPKLDEKNISIVTAIPEVLPNLDADRDLVTRVFINLINNAVKYSPTGTTITIAACEQAVDVQISVEDEGIGIPEEQRSKIFDKYYRVKSDRSREFEGVGLGLAIVKNIIEQHDGSISVESKENMGSKFTFTIPKEYCVNELLGYISEMVSAKSELHEMLELIVRMIAELLDAKIVSLMLLDRERSELFIKISYGLEEWIVEQARVKVGEGIAGKVAETGMPLLIDNIEENGIHESPNNPQYETVSLLSAPLFIHNAVVGVVNVNNKISGARFNQDDLNLLISFGERISKALERFRSAEDPHEFLQDTVEAFRKMLDLQLETKSIERTVDLALKLSRKLELSEKEIRVIQYVASVHDIGMTKISDQILNKAFDLSPDEMEQIQEHPQKGAELIRPLEFVELVSTIILHHHERVDGLGYPMGLKGDQIPIGSCILSVIDSYESMTAERPYRKRMSVEDAVKELIDCAGKQFDVAVVKSFVELLHDEGRLDDTQLKEFRRLVDMARGAVPSHVS